MNGGAAEEVIGKGGERQGADEVESRTADKGMRNAGAAEEAD